MGSPLRLLQHETGRLQPPQMPGRPMSAPALPEARPEHAGPPCACHHPQAASRAPPHLPRIPQLQPCTSPVGWDDRVACRPLPLPWPHSLSTSHGTMSFHSWNRVPRSSMTHTPGRPLLPRPHGPHCPTDWPSQPFRILEGAGIIADFEQDPPQPPWQPHSLPRLPKFPLSSPPQVSPTPGSLCICHCPQWGPT